MNRPKEREDTDRSEEGSNHQDRNQDGNNDNTNNDDDDVVNRDPHSDRPQDDDGTRRSDHNHRLQHNPVVMLSPHLYRGLGLGPMVRASTTPLRILALQRGADWCYTEELVDRSLIGLNRVERTLPSGVHVVDFEKPMDQVKRGKKRTHQASAAAVNIINNNNKNPNYHPGGSEWPGPPVLLRIDPLLEAGRLVCQLGTSDPNLALQAALVVHRDVSAIDINMGCPKRFSTLGGMGASLLRDPDRACRIIRHLRSHLPHQIPVSAKIRLLENEDNGGEPSSHATIDFCRGLIRAGASAIAIHGRTVQDRETCDSRREVLTNVLTAVASEFPHIPVCANGDFYTRNEVTNFLRDTGASGILLSRPALYDTNLFGAAPLPPFQVPGREREGSSSDSSPVVAEDWAPADDRNIGRVQLPDVRTDSIRDYLRLAVRYDASSANAKYVVGEMLQWRRRTPANRVLPLTEPTKWISSRPSLNDTCACKSLGELCQLWGINAATVTTTATTTTTTTPTIAAPLPSVVSASALSASS